MELEQKETGLLSLLFGAGVAEHAPQSAEGLRLREPPSDVNGELAEPIQLNTRHRGKPGMVSDVREPTPVRGLQWKCVPVNSASNRDAL